jgi:hypothetical protein
MATALQPKLDTWAMIAEFRACSTQWALALDAAQSALLDAPEVLPVEALRGRLSLLTAERADTTQLLRGLAHDLRVDAWVSDLRA